MLGIFKHPIMCGEWEAIVSCVMSVNLVSHSLNSHAWVLSSYFTVSRWRIWFAVCAVDWKPFALDCETTSVRETQDMLVVDHYVNMHTPILCTYMNSSVWYKTIEAWRGDNVTGWSLYQFPQLTFIGHWNTFNIVMYFSTFCREFVNYPACCRQKTIGSVHSCIMTINYTV